MDNSNIYIIKVEGNVIANDQIHYAQNWVSCKVGITDSDNSNYTYNEHTHTVTSNLILNKDRRAVPYAIYVSEKGTAACSTGELAACSGFMAAYYNYDNFMQTIISQLEAASKLPKYILPLVYKSLFTDLFSILELFLSDTILCLIYTNKILFEKAKEFYRLKKEKGNTITDLENKTHKFFFNEVVYHKFDKVNDIYYRVAGVSLPNCSQLQKFLHKRNNIVHRYSLSNIDRMRVTTISKQDVEDLIITIDTFVDKLLAELSEKYK